VRVIHIDNSSQGTSVTSRTLVAGTSAYNDGLGAGEEGLALEGKTFEDFNHRDRNYDPLSTIFLATVAETELSFRNHQGEIEACRSLATAQRIALETPSAKVFLIPVSSGIALTGVDVVAGLPSGISGVVDERGLVMSEVLDMIHEYPELEGFLRIRILSNQGGYIVDLVKPCDAVEAL
jgi:hypothetical protein